MGMALKDVVTAPDRLMGVKAVQRRSREAVMCFVKQGTAQTTVERARTQPYFLTIGSGKKVSRALKGRVLELVRATGERGDTAALVQDVELREWLAQWPYAIIISEVYSIVDEPHLVEDLGFPDRQILDHAYDRVGGNQSEVQRLWEALKDKEIERRWNVLPPPGFRDPGKVQVCGSMYPRLDSTSPEGERVWTLSEEIERDPRLRAEVKALNCARNGGVLVCEACGFADPCDAMFDAHHRQPLAAGTRESRVDDLAVLCPTCHRCAHVKTNDKLAPVPVEKIAELLNPPHPKVIST